MNMTTREIARFGQLYLQKGTWNGKTVLSPEWTTLATARHTWSGEIKVHAETIASGNDWRQGYGFQFWRCRHNCYRADGAAGQFTIVMPDQDAVVSIHAGLKNMQKELDLIWDHLLPAMQPAALPPDDAAAAALAARCKALAIPPVPGKDGVRLAFDGRQFPLAENKRGFKSVRFDSTASGWDCILATPAGEQRFPVGRGAWAKGHIRVDPIAYEGLGALIGVLSTAASGGVDSEGNFNMRAYLTGTMFYIEFRIDAAGNCKGRRRKLQRPSLWNERLRFRPICAMSTRLAGRSMQGCEPWTYSRLVSFARSSRSRRSRDITPSTAFVRSPGSWRVPFV